MKTLVFLAALSLGTVAIAQDPGTPPANSSTGSNSAPMSTAPDGMMTPPPADGGMATTPDPTMTPPATSPAMPSDQGMAPPPPADPGMSAPMDPAMSASGSAAPMATASTENYPTCSRTVKDRCKNRGSK